MQGLLVEPLRGALSREGGVELALLFGSRARGRHRPDSDLDLAVRAPATDLLALAARLSLGLSIEVHPVMLDQAGFPLLRELVDFGVVIHERTAGSAALWRSRALASLETDGPWFRRMRDAYLAKLAKGTSW